MSSRPARHRRPDQASLSGEQLLARLGARPAAGTAPAGTGSEPPSVAGWVPQRPDEPLTSEPTRTRWAPTGRAVGGLAAVVLVAVLVALVVVWQAQPTAQAAPRVRRDLPAASAIGSAASTTATAMPAVVVHVVGAVRRPGVVRLPGGARVADAVRAAGGATPAARLASVNLARVLVDGEQLVVQRRGRAVVLGALAAGSPPAAGTAPPVPVDLNTATLEMLDGLPGIGPVLAQRILDWRSAHTRFSSVDELGEVSGIGEATLSDLQPLVVV